MDIIRVDGLHGPTGEQTISAINVRAVARFKVKLAIYLPAHQSDTNHRNAIVMISTILSNGFQ